MLYQVRHLSLLTSHFAKSPKKKLMGGNHETLVIVGPSRHKHDYAKAAMSRTREARGKVRFAMGSSWLLSIAASGRPWVGSIYFSSALLLFCHSLCVERRSLRVTLSGLASSSSVPSFSCSSLAYRILDIC